MSATETIMEIADIGAIKRMQVPAGWMIPPEDHIPAGGPQSIKMYPVDGSIDSSLMVFLWGNKAPHELAQAFARILRHTPHELATAELDDIQTMLRGADNPSKFQPSAIRTISLNGKTVLLLSGVWLKDDSALHWLLFDASGNGEWIQEIIFSAPTSKLAQHEATVKDAISSIEWKQL